MKHCIKYVKISCLNVSIYCAVKYCNTNPTCFQICSCLSSPLCSGCWRFLRRWIFSSVDIFLAWSFENSGNSLLCWRLAVFFAAIVVFIIYIFIWEEKKKRLAPDWFDWYLLFLKFQKCNQKNCIHNVISMCNVIYRLEMYSPGLFYFSTKGLCRFSV